MKRQPGNGNKNDAGFVPRFYKEEPVLILLFYVKKNIIVNFTIQKLTSKHTSFKKYEKLRKTTL